VVQRFILPSAVAGTGRGFYALVAFNEFEVAAEEIGVCHGICRRRGRHGETGETDRGPEHPLMYVNIRGSAVPYIPCHAGRGSDACALGRAEFIN